MGQFKPMVKMMTTEPSVELKLKKGGSVKSMSKMKTGDTGSGHKKMADGGGAMSAIMGTPALVGRPAVNAPVRTPGKPPMAARRKAMAAKPAMKEGGESKAEHKAEMKAIKDVKSEVKAHASKPASKAHKGLKTGGVAMGNAGGYKAGGATKKYAKGGIINTENQGGAYRNTKMHTAEYTGKTSGTTGGVKEGNAGGYKTGGVALGNAGGFKSGGKAKKAYAAGGTVDSGSPVAMPQGRKKPSAPVSINQLSGTFKKGGSVTPAQGRLMKNFDAENATAMRQAKAQSNEVYSKYQKMAGGGDVEDMSKGAYDAHYAREKAENEAMREAILGAPKRLMESVKGFFKGEGQTTEKESEMMGKMQKPKSVTKTEKSVTVTPGKKRGGRAC